MADVRRLADYRRLRPAPMTRTDVLAVDATINIEGMTAAELLALATRADIRATLAELEE